MLTIFGILIILCLIYFLLRDKMSPMVALIIVPFVGIVLYWASAALGEQKVVPNNYAYMLERSYNETALKDFAKQQGYSEPSESQISTFRAAGLSALKLKQNAKINSLTIDFKKLSQFYTAGLVKVYPDSQGHQAFVESLTQQHGFFDSIKDHASELSKYYKEGTKKVAHIAAMFIFAILFFGVLNDLGLFRPAIDFIIRVTDGNVIAICVGTCLIAMIAHLDGSGATTFLVVVPPLLPLYRRLNISPYLLILLVAASAGLVNMLPWGGPLGRIASVLGVDTVELFYPLIQVMVFGAICIVLMAIVLGVRENRRLANPAILEANQALYAGDSTDAPEEALTPTTRKRYLTNLLIALGTLAVMIMGLLPPELCFMLALCVILLVNYRTPAERMARLKAHASGAIAMGTILLAAGVYIGILTSSGMLSAIATSLANLLPDWSLSYLHVIVGIVGVPFELFLDTNGYYYTLFPIVNEITQQYGVAPEAAAYAMMIGSIVGTFCSPFSPALWLGLGLAKLSMGRHIMYSIFWLWGLSLVIMLFSHFAGLF